MKKSARSDLEAMLTRQSARVRRAFNAFLANTRDERMMAQITRLLQRGRVEQALQIVDQHIIRLAEVLPKVFATVAAAEIRSLSRRAGVGISFNPGDPRAAELMSQSKLRFIQQFTEAQRETTRAALTDALAQGKGPRESARAFRDSIGLTYDQQKMVNNYQRSLETGSADALDRALRDRRFDRTVESVIDGESILSAEQIERMVGRYSENMLAHRAETIARTEALTALSEARQESLRQLLDETGIDPDSVVRTWVATDDYRTRDTHAELDGVETSLDEPWVTIDGNELMYPGDPDAPPEEIINCRCTFTTDFVRDEDRDDAE